MAHPEKTERNERIFEMVVRERRKQTDVAKLFGITQQRVSEIVNREGLRRDRG